MRARTTLITSLIILMSVFVQTAQGQRAPMRFGKIDNDDLKMTRFEADSSAKALILGDYGMVEFKYDNNNGFQSYFRRHLRVKIFDLDAAHLADFKLPIHISGSEKERLTQLRGRVYNMEDGRVRRTRFSRGDAFHEEVSDFFESVNFTLPDIREGCIFEIEYTIVSPFLFTLPQWIFQKEYPVRFSEVRFLTPEYFTYKPLMQGYLPLDKTDRRNRKQSFNVQWEEQGFLGKVTKHNQRIEYDENIVIYRMEDIPAISIEPHMNAPINYVTKIEHELLSFRWPYGTGKDFSSNWNKLTTNLLNSESFGKLLVRSGFLQEEIQQIVQNHPEPLQRVIAAYQLVQEHMHWNNTTGVYAQSGNLRRAWSAGEGNVSDINLLLVLLLTELDLDVDPVILSTRNHGMINYAQIMLDKFNYVIASVRVDNKLYLLDATDKDNPWFLLPERCLNGQGRIVSQNRNGWVNLLNNQDNHTYTQTNLKVSPNGHLTAEVNKHKVNYHRLKHQKYMSKFDSQEAFMDDVESSSPGLEIVDYHVENLQDWSQPLISTYHYEMPAIDDVPKDVIYLQPLLNDRYAANPFRLEERFFPVDFVYPFKRSFYVLIEVPEGYEVEEMPDNKSFRLPNESASYQISSMVNMQGNVVINVVMEISKSLFLPDEYSMLREFFAIVVEEEANAVILKKM